MKDKTLAVKTPSNDSFMGLSLSGIMKKMKEARNLGRSGRFLDPKSISFGTSLTTFGLRVLGSELSA